MITYTTKIYKNAPFFEIEFQRNGRNKGKKHEKIHLGRKCVNVIKSTIAKRIWKKNFDRETKQLKLCCYENEWVKKTMNFWKK